VTVERGESLAGADGAPLMVVFMTAPSDEVADSIARALVDEGLAACVNSVGGMHSVFRWEGRTESAEEHLLIAKTSKEGLGTLMERVKGLHPYEVPEIIALPILEGFGPYLEWVAENSPAEDSPR
jgi:periplasmic divalent cation tolerance protein